MGGGPVVHVKDRAGPPPEDKGSLAVHPGRPIMGGLTVQRPAQVGVQAFRLFRSVASKAAKLVCVLFLAVAPLVNIWHPVRSGQNELWPASFDWSDILRLAHRWPPLLALTSTSPSNLHGGLMGIMGGLGATCLRGAVEASYWVFKCGGLRPGMVTSGWPGLAWWTWFRWYSPCIQSWGAICRG